MGNAGRLPPRQPGAPTPAANITVSDPSPCSTSPQNSHNLEPRTPSLCGLGIRARLTWDLRPTDPLEAVTGRWPVHSLLCGLHRKRAHRQASHPAMGRTPGRWRKEGSHPHSSLHQSKEGRRVQCVSHVAAVFVTQPRESHLCCNTVTRSASPGLASAQTRGHVGARGPEGGPLGNLALALRSRTRPRGCSPPPPHPTHGAFRILLYHLGVGLPSCGLHPPTVYPCIRGQLSRSPHSAWEGVCEAGKLWSDMVGATPGAHPQKLLSTQPQAPLSRSHVNLHQIMKGLALHGRPSRSPFRQPVTSDGHRV